MARAFEGILVRSLLAGAAMGATLLASPAFAQSKDMAKAREAVRTFDADGDGRISREEWTRSPGAFRKIDADKDGFLTVEEFARFWGGQSGAGEDRQADGDGSRADAPRAPGASAAAGVPMIDAHSQVDCNVGKDLVLGQLDKLRISRVLVSIRGCKGWRSEDLEARTLQWSGDHPDRISALLSTKVDGWSFNELDPAGLAAFDRRAGRDGFVGMGEVLVQHAAHDHAQLKYPELALALDDPRVARAIAVARARKWPVTLHVELNDNEESSRRTLDDLHRLLERHPDTPFLLIHMGQASPQEARALLERHRNIHFLTSHADDLAAFSIKGKSSEGTSQSGWINLFEGNCHLNECPSGWNREWLELVTRFPTRFVLAFDNVFPKHWEKRFEIRVGIWRRALAMLPPDVAHALAHRNAERLWRLPPAN